MKSSLHKTVSDIKEKSSSAAPFFQPKLTIGPVDDMYEREADAVAEQVMRKPAGGNYFFKQGLNQIQRKCTHGEDEERVQKKTATTIYQGQSNSAVALDSFNSGGRPLEPDTRNFMELRLGADFSSVRVHDDHRAQRSSRTINALAYTHGNNIVFGKDQYNPATDAGKRLIAHELTHVIQQNNDNVVRRMSFGKGKPPDDLKDVALMEVPEEEMSLVNAAINILRNIAKNRDKYSGCHQSFAETCPNGESSSLENAFDSAILWRRKKGIALGAGATTFAIGDDRRNVAYTDNGYAGGTNSLAFDLLHELGHVCGISFVAQPHYMTDKLALYCLGPTEKNNDTNINVRFGVSADSLSLMLSYGWLLHEWKGGRLGLKLNTSFDVTGAISALQVLSDSESSGGGIADASLEFNLRPFSGQRFGGLSFHAGLGGQFGSYRLRQPTEKDPEEIRFGAAAVLEVGGRIQWWVKDDEAVTDSGEIGRVKPWDIDLSYRLIQPVTPGAKRSHELLLSKKWFF